MTDPDEPPESSVSSSTPTGVRHAVVAVTALASILLYLDRVCISFAGTYIREDLGLGLQEMGYVLGAFFFAYALAQVPSGWLGDRVGARSMMTAYILAWSFFTASTSLAWGLVSLLAARLAFGVAQSGAYPTAASLLGRWVPERSRGVANSLVALGGRIGGATAPLITSLLLVAFTTSPTAPNLQDRDLLDAPKLAREILGTEPNPSPALVTRLRERAGQPALGAAATVADRASSEVARKDAVSTLARWLDVLIADPRLVDGVDLSGLSLPREARSILGKGLEDRTTEGSRRLNRLVLEAAFPGAIRQMYGNAWRPVLLSYAFLGMLVALAYWLIVRDWPHLHPGCNQAEVRLIEGEKKDQSDKDSELAIPNPGGGIPWGRLARSRNLSLSSLAQFCINLGWAFLVTLLPAYLNETFAVPIEERGLMSSIPLLLGCLGMLAGGRATDVLARRLGLRWGRALPIGVAPFVSAIAFLSCPFIPTAWGVVVALVVVAMAIDFAVPSTWALVQDIGGRDVGSALGWGNMWGNFGAALSPVVLAAVRESFGWSSVFVACAASFAVSGVAGLLIDARKPLSP
ncbi:MFS transporter [Tundrisphaera lichenicola]|uniref:MFS transporter n=1 Tax=Tundrisphaera lichenicola TaxID=2029860 RepID=UPI003EB82153